MRNWGAGCRFGPLGWRARRLVHPYVRTLYVHNVQVCMTKRVTSNISSVMRHSSDVGEGHKRTGEYITNPDKCRESAGVQGSLSWGALIPLKQAPLVRSFATSTRQSTSLPQALQPFGRLLRFQIDGPSPLLVLPVLGSRATSWYRQVARL